MKQTILVTGSSGLIGSNLCTSLTSEGFTIRRFDIRANGIAYGDIRKIEQVHTAVEGCVGIVHLAAVSRVIWAEKDPDLCWETNVDGFHNLLEAAAIQRKKPWILFASSREVYGQPEQLPANEDTPFNPINIYAQSKVEGERLVLDARNRGLQTATIRLSNVFGSPYDHIDRVIPAFVRAAVTGEALRVEGSNHTFDFTYIDDVVRGIRLMIKAIQTGNLSLPPIHLTTGYPTTLRQLAEMATRLAESNAPIVEAMPRSFDVAHFYGEPTRARKILGWLPLVPLEEGLRRLIEAFRFQFDF